MSVNHYVLGQPTNAYSEQAQAQEKLDYEVSRLRKAREADIIANGCADVGIGLAGAVSGAAECAAPTGWRLVERAERLEREARDLRALYSALPRELPPEAERALRALLGK